MEVRRDVSPEGNAGLTPNHAPIANPAENEKGQKHFSKVVPFPFCIPQRRG